MTQHFCLECGAQISNREIDGRFRGQCPACGWIHYLHLKVSTAVLIEQDGALLLLQRAYDPWQGSWNLPAGYVEVDETPRQAAVREVREETGLEVNLGKLLGNYYFDDDPRGNGLLVVYEGTDIRGELNGSGECIAHGYFLPDNLPRNLCGAGHSRLIRAWKWGEFKS